jgi:hypothetical protein
MKTHIFHEMKNVCLHTKWNMTSKVLEGHVLPVSCWNPSGKFSFEQTNINAFKMKM